MQRRDLQSPQSPPAWLSVVGAFALMMVFACALCVFGTGAMLTVSESLLRAANQEPDRPELAPRGHRIPGASGPATSE